MTYRLEDFVKRDPAPPGGARITLSLARRRKLLVVLGREARGTYLRGFGKR